MSLYPHAPLPRNGDVHRPLPGSVPSSPLHFPYNSHISFPCPSEAKQLGRVCHLGSVLTLNSLIKCLSNLTPLESIHPAGNIPAAAGHRAAVLMLSLCFPLAGVTGPGGWQH